MTDYKKLYEEALKRARDLHDNHTYGEPQNWWTCEKIFPELKESEDERVRKEIQSAIKQLDKDSTICGKKYDYNQWLAWLEKQGEKLPVGFYYVDSNGNKYFSDTFKNGNFTFHVEKGEQIPANFEKTCKDEQKPAWSKEDEHRVRDTIYFLDTAKKHYASDEELNACIDWLKSLKDRILI